MPPAEDKSFTEDDPPNLVLFDTSFVVATLVVGERQHDACLQFAARLLEVRTVVIYSTTLHVEYHNTWRRLIEKGLLPPEPSGQLAFKLGIPEERPHWFRVADNLLRRFLSQFPRREVRLNRRILSTMVSLMGRYNLKSLDAIQVASAWDVGCNELATLDDDFRRVDGLRLWNNRRR